MHGTFVTHGNFVAMRVAPAMPKGEFAIGMQQPPPVKSLYVSAKRDASTLLEGHMFV
jgi:hypothetical protein